jgi:hypothetical protein
MPAASSKASYTRAAKRGAPCALDTRPSQAVRCSSHPAGNWKQYTNDVFGNLVTALEPNPSAGTVNPPSPVASQYPLAAAPSGSNTLFTRYIYDQLTHLTAVNISPGRPRA